ncbi:protein-L-isoaspartate O-methyltransferase family protein [Halapricum desulfuricans]|uniref:protein-L-isoaspartate(D-aspartate) O-methyltransferase n=1 Tax=Halapricum desulfuricans TaxID=2841257 RepID=A0A897N343_9EURY|nr:protein-L-isoaspartate O-methyltransferase [Halapricum desulfuricans]QSG08820.1 Protein-L-isoaspartate carboxylmethyltransferase [Halapricum desulfuricans]QSG11768.1 Protein-L-isoaspartate carboxylmethyltransferase [Halapricum desulfuricans]
MDPAVLREDMVDSLEHESKGCLGDEQVSLAMRSVEREAFVEEEAAYADRTFERHGTRVLAPSTAARLLDVLAPRPDERALVVGAGVGYTVAVIAEVVGATDTHAIDINRQLVYEARSNLSTAGYSEVLVDRRDGAEGLAAYAPYDCILLEAGVVEPPRALLEQLTSDGRLVAPLGAGTQTLSVVSRDGEIERHGTVAFQPMLVDGESPHEVERNRTHREDREFARKHAESRPGWEQDWIDWDDARR